MTHAKGILEVFIPRTSDHPIETVLELVGWMDKENANKISYGIGYAIAEGVIVESVGNEWHLQYTERGQKRILQTFQSETEIVRHTYQQIRNDPWAWSHCVGWFKIEADAQSLMQSLEERDVPAFCDQIPYGGPNDVRYRVFVFGRDSLNIAVLP